MTINTTDRKAGPFDGDGSRTDFPFEFKVYDKNHLLVILTSPAGVDTKLVLDVDYSVSLNANQETNPGGFITYLPPLAVGEKLTILTDQPPTQTTVLNNMGGFFPKTIEKQLDWLTILIQQIEEELGRAVKVGVTDEPISPNALLALQDLANGDVSDLNVSGTISANGAEIADLTVTDSITLPATSVADEALSNNIMRKNVNSVCPAQEPIIGSHPTDTRIRRANTTGALFLLGGTNNSVTTGARINLFGADHPTQPGNLTIAAGTSGTLTLAGGTIMLNNNAGISGALRVSGVHNFTSGVGAFVDWYDSAARFGAFDASASTWQKARLVSDSAEVSVDPSGAVSVVAPAGFTYDGSSVATHESGSFTGTLTGFTATVQGTIHWHRVGNRVILHAQSSITGTSDATTMTMTGLPVALRPSVRKRATCVVTDSGAEKFGRAQVEADGTIHFALYRPDLGGIFSAFADSSTKGLPDGWQMEYVLD